MSDSGLMGRPARSGRMLGHRIPLGIPDHPRPEAPRRPPRPSRICRRCPASYTPSSDVSGSGPSNPPAPDPSATVPVRYPVRRCHGRLSCRMAAPPRQSGISAGRDGLKGRPAPPAGGLLQDVPRAAPAIPVGSACPDVLMSSPFRMPATPGTAVWCRVRTTSPAPVLLGRAA